MKKIMILAICVAAFMDGRSQNGINITSTAPPSTTTIPTILTPDMTVVGYGVGAGGTNNSFFGNNAGAVNTSDDNCFFGYNSGAAATTTSEQNCFFGSNTGLVSTTSSHNCFFGYNAGSASTTTTQNCFFGWRAGVANITGSDNTFYGTSSGQAYTSGVDNVMIGGGSGAGATSGMANTFVGDKTGGSNLSGSFNSLLGFEAKLDGKSLQYATAIGSESEVRTPYSIVLGRANAGAGNYDLIGIGTPAPQYELDFEIQPNDYFYLSGIGAPVALPYQQLVLDANNYVSVVPAGPSTGENGISISPLDGNLVLGQDACGIGVDPAALFSTRYVPLNNQFLLFPDGPTAPSSAGEGRVGIGLASCGTPQAKLDIFKPNVVDDATPIGLQVINSDVTNSPGAPFGSGATAIGINASVTGGLGNPYSIGGQFNSSDASEASIGIFSMANTSSTAIDAFAIGGYFEATAATENVNGIYVSATTTSGSSCQGIGMDVSGAGSNCGIHAHVTSPIGSSNNMGGYFEVFNGLQTYGVSASAAGDASSTNYGGYFSATGGVGSINYAGYFAGDVYCAGSYLPSDEKLKSNVQDFSNSLDILQKLNVKSYVYNTDEYKRMNLPQGNQIGIMAQNMQSVLPNLVKQSIDPAPRDPKTQQKIGEDTKFLAVNYVGLVPVLVEAVKELDARTDSVSILRTALDNTNTVMGAQIAALQKQIDDLCSGGCASLRGSSTTTDPSSQPANQLLQNVPNPFSQQTTIGYVLNTGSTAYMNINGLDGKLLKHIPLAISGPGSITVGSSEMAPGTYTYSLYVDGSVVDTKLMVITAQD